jgi:hypothetical protein
VESPPRARSACREPVATKDMSDSLSLAGLVSASLIGKHFEMVGTEEAALEGNIAYPVSSSFKAGKFTKPPVFKPMFYEIHGSPIAPTAGALDHEFSSLWGYHSYRAPTTCVVKTKTVASLETSSRRYLSVLSHLDWFSLAVGNVIDVLGKKLPESDKEGRQLATLCKRLCESVGRVSELLVSEQSQVLATTTSIRRDAVLRSHKSLMTEDLSTWFSNQPLLQKSLFGRVNEVASPLVTLCTVPLICRKYMFGKFSLHNNGVIIHLNFSLYCIRNMP